MHYKDIIRDKICYKNIKDECLMINHDFPSPQCFKILRFQMHYKDNIMRDKTCYKMTKSDD